MSVHYEADVSGEADAAPPDASSAPVVLKEPRRFSATAVGRVLLSLPAWALLFVCWQLFSAYGPSSWQLAIPSLSSTVSAFWGDWSNSQMWQAIETTLIETFAGLGIAVAAGVVLGVLIGLSQTAEIMLWPIIVFFQAIPKIAMAPIFILALGFGISSKIALSVLVAFFPILVSVIQGMRTIRLDEIELMASLNATHWQAFWKVRVPRAVPAAFSGFQIGAQMALLGAVIAEFLGSAKGLGYLIAFRGSNIQPAGLFSAIIFLSIIAVLLSLVNRKLSGWEEA